MSGTDRPRPAHLYKYKSIAGKARTHVEKLFREGLIYFAPRREFNDPFDCRVHMIFRDDPDAYRKQLQRMYREKWPSLTDAECFARAFQVAQGSDLHSNPIRQRAFSEYMQSGVDDLGVLCLCERPDNLLMWSHYTQGHTGICLQFENRVMPGWDAPLAVTYADEFPPIDAFSDTAEQQAKATLLTKAADWAYEKEWRIIDTVRGSGERCFPPDLLSGVVFGCRSSQADREEIKRWIAAGPTNPQLYEAVERTGTYHLEVVSLPQTTEGPGF